MDKIHKKHNAQNAQRKGGQKELLCTYQNSESSDSLPTERAFDTLFEEVWKMKKNNHNETHSHLRQGLNF